MVSGGVGEALGFKDGMRRGPVSSIVRVVNGATGQPSASRPTRFLKTEAPSGSPLFPKLARDDASCGRGRRFVRRSNEAKLAAGLPRTQSVCLGLRLAARPPRAHEASAVFQS